MRSQDWVIKIDYADGTGDGHVIWRLGKGGDFKINSTATFPWFSHQHDARYINDTTLVLFDDGNVRQSQRPGETSRGQELILNERTMVATLVVNGHLGNYAPALGSAQALPNGNLVFGSGFAEQTIEVSPHGRRLYVLRMRMPGKEYRTYIYASLYGNPASLSLPTTPVPGALARRLAVLDRRVELRLRRQARVQVTRQHRPARPAVLLRHGHRQPSAPRASLALGHHNSRRG